MYYGYHCYSKDNKALGWFYTYSNDNEYAWTNTDLHWCKRWKTERGAKKHFDSYNDRWQFKSQGGYLKIEVMPEILEAESAHTRRQKLLKEWGSETVLQLPAKDKSPTLSFCPKPEILQWLEEERAYNDGEPEPDTVLINRKLKKLMKLEQQKL